MSKLSGTPVICKTACGMRKIMGREVRYILESESTGTDAPVLYNGQVEAVAGADVLIGGRWRKIRDLKDLRLVNPADGACFV